MKVRLIMFKTKILNPFFLLFLSIFCLVILRPLLQKGMFLDGITYAAISRNLSLHIGSIWDLFYTKTIFPNFHEHPLMVFWLQSKLFILFGPESSAENIYCFIIVFLQLSLMALYWVIELKYPSYTLCILGLFWLAVPLNHLYTDNILEGTLTLFTTLAGFLLLKKKHLFRNQVLSVGAMVLGILSNGPTALFPLAIPMLKKGDFFKKSFKTLVLLTMLIAAFAILFLIEPKIIENLKQYFLIQLLPSMSGQRNSNFEGLRHLLIFKFYLRGFWIGGIFAFIIFLIDSQIEKKCFFILIQAQMKKTELRLFFLISLISSLPVGLFSRLNFNYIMQSGPWMSLFLASLCLEPILKIANAMQSDVTKLHRIMMTFLMVVLIYCLCSIGKYRRDRDMIEDILIIKNKLPQNEMITTTPEVLLHFYEAAYFARYTSLTITEEDKKYFINFSGKSLPDHYKQINLPLKYFVLAKKISYFSKS